MPRDYDVFISYCHEDKAEAQSLNRLLLEQMGLKTWFDDQDILAGESIVRAVEKGLSQSLACLVLVGESGQGTWQQEEIQAALQRQMEQSYFRVIPVLLPSAKVEPNWPLFLRGKLHIDLRKSYFDGLRKLLQAIRGRTAFPLYSRLEQVDFTSVDGRDDTSDEETLPGGYTADVNKIVELLIGESLYSRKDVCIRELIQNAVDACQRRKARMMIPYEPNVVLKINSKEAWFEVDDNGEGMNPDLLRNSFAIIGKSIRDEEALLQLIKEKRAHVIAKFGIGFVSTFMVSDRVLVSTTFEGERQVNLSIKAFNQRFSYTDMSECGRDANKGNNILDESNFSCYYCLTMTEKTNTPKTLQEAIVYFADVDRCINYLASRRWPNGVVCPTCGRTDVRFLENQRKWQCKSVHPRRQFSVKVETIFEDSPLGLDKWLLAVWMITNCKNGVSSYEIHRAIGVTQKTAWFMLHRIRLAMQTGSFEKK